ncbi:MAG: hypothetical protein MJY86_03145 [Bacteroidales bacterium]|nr:hypothetical protein [Bacteroidales bacterium]
MKRTILAISLALTAASAGAQTMYDALTFSKNEYYGTARSIAMGNAMTAVGGDLGSIGINPAGSAVYNFSQFTITPNLTISSETGSYSAYPVNGADAFKNSQLTNFTKFSMPNIGATLNMSTGNRHGLKGITFGFVVNSTNNFTGKTIGGGLNDKTSYLSCMAVDAFGYDTDFLNGFGYVDNNGQYHEFSKRDTGYPYDNPDDRGYYAPWNIVSNAQAGAISTFGDAEDPDYLWRYIAATEGFKNTGEMDQDGNYIYDIFLGGPLNQAYGRMTTGGKRDVLMNVGFNFNENFYVGANIGITSMNYNYDEYYKEAADDPSNFVIEYDEGTTYFSDYRTRYSYAAEGTGVYAKIGFIALPAPGLRIGGAIQTPTWLSIDEIWKNSVDVNYMDSKYNSSATSPEGNYSYNVRTPYRANFGVAYSFLGQVLLSADYEMADYKSMKFSGVDDWGSDSFEDVNAEIKDCMGVSHSVRVGAEFKPVPELAVRAGYNYTMTPEYNYDSNFRTKLTDSVNSYSVGLGYSSKGSFFADIAGRMTTFCDEYISPYADYLEDLASPLILNKRERYSITATIGWRF